VVVRRVKVPGDAYVFLFFAQRPRTPIATRFGPLHFMPQGDSLEGDFSRRGACVSFSLAHQPLRVREHVKVSTAIAAVRSLFRPSTATTLAT
jgi:hypothetical protein